ncbi:MAG: glycosyltransferase, partial [Pseudomonadota bacterium]
FNKGAGLLPQIVPSLLSAGFQVVVQDSGNLMQGESGGNLTLLGYVEDIVSEIEKCDLVVVPYDPATYRSQGSSIVWEAIACGVPVVVPLNSAPGKFAISCGGGIGFAKFDAAELCNTVFAAAENYRPISEGAFHASKNWAASNGAGRYADALLSCA